MTTTSLKKQLHKVIDLTTDTTILQAVYTILNRNFNSANDLDLEQYKAIDERKKLYSEGKLGTVTREEISKRAYAKIRK